ncbi:MAG: hypothetical protein Q9170_008190, partial [Blastenia crenularia]
MASASNALVFARIVPEGPEAEDALDFVCNDDQISDHHRSFIHVDLEPRDRPKDLGSDSSSLSDWPDLNHTRTGRYFTLSLEQPIFQPFSVGWRLGRDPAKFSSFTGELYRRYVEQRNTILATHACPRPYTGLSAIYRHQDTKRGRVITYGTLSTGKYGIVCAGVVADSGEPIAVKQHRADTAHELRLIQREAYVGMQFQLPQGLLPILFRWCEHQFIDVCDQVPQALFTASPLALCDFSRVPWRGQNLSFVRDCFRGPVLGLATLHAAGYMHRDVHTKNLFLIRSQPPEAVLGDFGKTIKAASASDAALGPVNTCAPEVDGRTQYTSKIDIWSLGTVLLRAVDPNNELRNGEFPSPQWYQCLNHHIENVKRNRAGTLDADVSDLIRCMLRWDPEDRPTALQILEHPFFI